LKKIATAAIAAAIFFAASAALAVDILDAEITIRDGYAIIIDGATVQPDVPPVEKGGMIFIPIRFAAEALRADVTWHKENKIIDLRFPGNRQMTMKIGDTTVDMGDTEKILPAAPFIFESRAMIPLRPVAEQGWFKVKEQQDASILVTDPDIYGYQVPPEESVVPGEKSHSGSLDAIREKARKDETTKKLKIPVLTAWAALLALWAWLFAFRLFGKKESAKDLVIIGLCLTAGMVFVLYGGILMSTYWAGIVILVMSAIGLVSNESYQDKLVTMASTAQGAGLICTLFGLGLLIGPAIAQRDIEAIGFGIYVKIEPTITGLALSIILNMLFGYEARRKRI